MFATKKPSALQQKYNIGDKVAFSLERRKYVGKILKKYNNSFLIKFSAKDPYIIRKYHNRTIINNHKIKLIKRTTKKHDK